MPATGLKNVLVCCTLQFCFSLILSIPQPEARSQSRQELSISCVGRLFLLVGPLECAQEPVQVGNHSLTRWIVQLGIKGTDHFQGDFTLLIYETGARKSRDTNFEILPQKAKASYQLVSLNPIFKSCVVSTETTCRDSGTKKWLQLYCHGRL